MKVERDNFSYLLAWLDNKELNKALHPLAKVVERYTTHERVVRLIEKTSHYAQNGAISIEQITSVANNLESFATSLRDNLLSFAYQLLGFDSDFNKVPLPSSRNGAERAERIPVLVKNLQPLARYIANPTESDSAQLPCERINVSQYNKVLVALAWRSNPDTIQALGRNAKLFRIKGSNLAEGLIRLSVVDAAVIDRIGYTIEKKIAHVRDENELFERVAVSNAVLESGKVLGKIFDDFEALTVDQIRLATRSMLEFKQHGVGYYSDGKPNESMLAKTLKVAIEVALKDEVVTIGVASAYTAATAPSPASAPAVAA